MTTPTPPEAAAGDGHQEGAGAPRSGPDPVAVSPAIGPLPAIYVPAAPSQASTAGLLWPGMVRAARWGVRWATRHPPSADRRRSVR